MSKEKLIDLDQEQLDLLHAILKQHIPNKTVWAYGSRVTWKARETSDLDLAVFDCTPMEIYDLKEDLEESDLLISVDVMDWEAIPESFREKIREKYVVVQEEMRQPEGWREVRLGDLIEVKHGYAFKGQFITDQENDKILVTPGNFKIGGGFKSSKLKYFTGQVPQNYILKADDVIVTMTDLSKNGDTLGYSAKVPQSKTGKTYLHNQRIGLLQFELGTVNQDFIYWLLRTTDYHWFVVGAASGTSIKHTSPTAIKEYQFLLPPLPEQKAIAEVLSSLDDKIDLLHRQNRTLEAMAQALFRKWFAEDKNEKWDVFSLYDVIELVGGGTPSTSVPEYWGGEVGWVSGKDVAVNHKGIIPSAEKSISVEGLKNSSAKLIPKHSTIISARGTVGKYGIVSGPMAFSQSNYGIKPKFGASYFFTYLLVDHSIDGLQSAAYGSVFDTITTDTFKEHSVKLPQENVIQEFEIEVTPLFEKMISNQSQIQILENLRDALLPKLMSGDVSLKEESGL